MPIRLRLLAVVLLALAAALLAPADAAAQNPPPCISCPPGGGGPEVPEEPPAVDISPFDQSFTADAAGKSQQVTIVFCSGWRIFPGTLKVVLNGVDVATRFSADTSTNTFDAGCTHRMTSVGTVTLGPGANTLFAAASNVHGQGEGTTTLSYRVASYGISVTPDQNEVVLPAGTTATHPFVLTNTGSSAATFNVTTFCGEAVSNCPASNSQVTLAGGASHTVTVTYMSWSPGAFGTLRLRATRDGVAGAYDEGSLMVSVPTAAGGQGAPAPVAVDPLGGASPTPGLCLTMPAGPAAAYQCGDLRLAHALPTVRTLGRARTPMLVYNSAHAAPMALVGARVKLPSGAASPTLGRATLTLNTVGQIDTRDYAGGEFTPNRDRRFTLGKLSTGLATSLYDYTLSFSFFYGATQLQGTTTGTVGIVNRSASPFGAGWWLAGLEQIQPVPGVIVWTGGDGAQRRYVYHAPNTFVAPTVTHADTIRWTGYVYVRVLPAGDTVFFNTDGRHVATADRLGRRTTFSYDGLGRLIHIFVPTGRGLPRNRESHRFVYDAQGRLAEVQSHDAAGSWTTPRRTLIAYALGDRRVTSITDPDGGTVHFTYDAVVPLRIASRTDRRGNPTTWLYDGAGKLAEASTSLGAGEVPARTRWQAAESRGWAQSSGHASTVVDGPRVDVPDVATFAPGPFGAPADIVDADGRVTRIVHDAAFPALAREVTTPSGQKTAATYDARGNVRFVTDSSTTRVIDGVLRYATTEYRYEDPRFPTFPTLIIPPEGDSTRIAYDADGRREWMRDARGDSTRVTFTYDAATGQVATVRTAKAAALGHPPESFFYDALGNLERTQGALPGDVSHQRMDGLGRVVRTVSPLFAHTALASDSAYTVSTYDVMDRVRTTESVGPAMTLPQNGVATPRLLTHLQTERERLLVETFYDAEGRADSIARWALPDSAQLGRMVTRWSYDAAGRAVREIAADGAVEHRAYDAAGNLTGTVTRRGHVLATSHDAMNRVVRQVTPAVGYPRVPFQVGSQSWVYPMYQPDGPGSFSDAANTTGLTIPADTAVFAYDSAGRMVRADNRDARITRAWNVNGTLASETQRIRTYRDTVFTAHVYTLTHTYDLNGRRTRTQHPASLAPAGGSGANTYRYHPHGALAAAGTMLNLASGDSTSGGTGYSWDAEGKLVARSGFTQLSLAYDAGGRLVRRVEGAGVPMHDDTLVYDLRGKVVEVTARRENHVALHRYSGLGGLVYSLNRDLSRNTQSLEEFRLDPLANQRSRHQSSSALSTIQPKADDAEGYTYQPGTGRLLLRQGTTAGEGSIYDASGNQVESRSRRRVHTPYTGDNGNTELYSNTFSYYGADERLRVVDRKTCILMPGCNPSLGPPTSDRGAFEEHRYDALGRRVLTRTRQEQGCVGADCAGAVVRTVWDGDQILYEIRAPGGPGASALVMERDTGHQVPVGNGAGWYGFGRVAYAHGLGIDDPVSVFRMDYSAGISWPAAIQPTANWAGTYDGGVGGACVQYNGMESTRLQPNVFPPGEEREPSIADNGGSFTHCIDVDWPANGVWRNLNEKPTQFHPRRSWMGSLLRHGRDASGQYYRRNRYYDAGTGRFTQEDPIGLAGGMNLYGYANGDPIRYADPFGLRADTIAYDSDETRQIVEGAAAKSPSLGEALEDLHGDPRHLIRIRQAQPGALGAENPGAVKPIGYNNKGQYVIDVVFDFSQVPAMQANPRYAAHGGVTRDDVVGHEVFGHVWPWTGGVIMGSYWHCDDQSGCARDRENIIRSEMGRPPRTW